MEKLLGANWRTSVTSITGTIMAVATWLSTVSYDTSPLALIIAPKYKPIVSYICGIATVTLWIANGLSQKDKSVKGGKVLQDGHGNVVEEYQTRPPIHIRKAP